MAVVLAAVLAAAMVAVVYPASMDLFVMVVFVRTA
jgi:hypothetical protein